MLRAVAMIRKELGFWHADIFEEFPFGWFDHDERVVSSDESNTTDVEHGEDGLWALWLLKNKIRFGIDGTVRNFIQIQKYI